MSACLRCAQVVVVSGFVITATLLGVSFPGKMLSERTWQPLAKK